MKILLFAAVVCSLNGVEFPGEAVGGAFVCDVQKYLEDFRVLEEALRAHAEDREPALKCDEMTRVTEMLKSGRAKDILPGIWKEPVAQTEQE